MVQTPCELHLKLTKRRDAVYSYDTVPKVYLPDCLSLPWDLIDSLYLLAVLLPSGPVGDWEFGETVHMNDQLCLEKDGFLSSDLFRPRTNRKQELLQML